MTFQDAVRKCLSNYTNFQGRAKRSEFWWFYLFTALVALVLYVVYIIFAAIASAASDNALGTIFAILSVIWSIAMAIVIIGLYIPLLAAGCRRLHDRGMSGWLQLLLLVPCGGIVLIIFWAMEGAPGDNAYGPQPV